MSVRPIVRKMIRKYGITVMRKKRTRTTGTDGKFYYTYSIETPIRGQLAEITPLDRLLNRYGESVTADWIATFDHEQEIEEGDLLEINSTWYEVQTKFERKTGNKVEYIEALLRKRT